MNTTANAPLKLWAEEEYGGFVAQRYRVTRTLFSGESDFQKIDIVDTVGHGRMLFIDGLAMISERDEFVYHDMIAHVPLFVHPDPRRVLVIGGGDGGTMREVIRHPSVEHGHLVEIDPVVVESCREHLPQTAAALADPRVRVTIGDGVKYVAETTDRYDVVLVDSTDPIGPATPLFGPEFYGNVQRILNDDGIVVSQCESVWFEGEWQKTITMIIGDLFARVHVYNYSNLTYPGGLWSFSFGTKSDRCPLGDLDSRRIVESGLTFGYYSEAVHRAAFALPEFQRRSLEGRLTPFR